MPRPGRTALVGIVRALHAMALSWRRRTRRLLEAAGLDVRRLAPGALLAVRNSAAREHWFGIEKQLAGFAVHHHVVAVLDKYGVNVVVDVGANTGQFARRLRAAGYAGRIVSFEPVPATFEELAAAAAPDPLWDAHPYALGREDGTTTINVVPGTLSSVLPATSFGAKRYTRLQEPVEHEVPLRRLDGLLDDLLAGLDEPRPYLKLDTQGFDLEAFAGLGDRASEFVGMQAEVALMRIYEGMPRMPEAMAAYESAGFEVTALYPVSRQSKTARVLEFDCVMVRAGAR
jgi:FkbM family methyltransferase